ncbi:hypothetical protein GQ44DRAFT_628898 [Phaeosphaeriaceae sp. PMI808]|nr:hypothetical protein GQ44DRAFT_628898 [Phaeosphaeriaceae sp. PMI808]
MRFKVSAIFAFATTLVCVSAQDLSSLPGCAIPCFAAAIQGSGCTLSDAKCQCTTGRDSISNSLLQCLPTRCSAQEQAKIAPAVQTLCAAAGVTISDVPTAVPSASSGGSATSAVNGTRAVSSTRSGTASPTQGTTQSTGAASSNHVAGAGAIALGFMAGVFAL